MDSRGRRLSSTCVQSVTKESEIEFDFYIIIMFYVKFNYIYIYITNSIYNKNEIELESVIWGGKNLYC